MTTAPPSSAHTKMALASQAWRLMFDYLIATSPARSSALAARGLTPNDSRALHSLDANEGRPIGALAREWGCDPSNATWIVDRLERAGLAERHPSPDDRRVKLVALTSYGGTVRAELMEEFRKPPPELLRLEQSELEELERILRKRTGDSRP